MNNIKALILVLAFSLVQLSCSTEVKTIPNTAESIQYMGRIDHSDSLSTFYWSGTSASINFSGSSVKVILKDETGDNYYNAILDGDSILVIRPGVDKSAITLFDNIPDGKHHLTLFKRTEYDRGHTDFYGFEIDGKVMPKPESKKRKIEFYGNSITAGYGIEDYSGQDRPDSIFTNNYPTYAALTARHFDAAYHCICKSGIGITISWFPTIMPEIYDRVDPRDPESKWDFSKYRPDIVVVNLMQNDSWLVNMPEHESFKHFFGDQKPDEEYIIDHYTAFIEDLRSHFPDASIICTMGSMDATREGSLWPKYVEESVERIVDDKIYTYFMPYKNTPGHPNIEENEVMANGFINFIENNIEW